MLILLKSIPATNQYWALRIKFLAQRKQRELLIGFIFTPDMHLGITSQTLFPLHRHAIHCTDTLSTAQTRYPLHTHAIHCTDTLSTAQTRYPLHRHSIHCTDMLSTAQTLFPLHRHSIHRTDTLSTAQTRYPLHNTTLSFHESFTTASLKFLFCIFFFIIYQFYSLYQLSLHNNLE